MSERVRFTIWRCPWCGEQGDPVDMAINVETARPFDPVCYHEDQSREQNPEDGTFPEVEVAHERIEVVPASQLAQARAQARSDLAAVREAGEEVHRLSKMCRADLGWYIGHDANKERAEGFLRRLDEFDAAITHWRALAHPQSEADR